MPPYRRYSVTMEILSFPFLFARKFSHAFQTCARMYGAVDSITERHHGHESKGKVWQYWFCRVWNYVNPVDRYWNIPCLNRRKAANNEGISLREPWDDGDTCRVIFDRIIHVRYHNSWCTCRDLYLWYTVLAYHCLLRDSLSIRGTGFRSRFPRCRYLEFIRGKLIIWQKYWFND